MHPETDFTPEVRTASAPAIVAESLLSHRSASMADLARNVAIAQRAGDLAYEFAQRAGAPLYQQSIAYHVAFAEKMAELGTRMPCPCDLCTGGEGGH